MINNNKKIINREYKNKRNKNKFISGLLKFVSFKKEKMAKYAYENTSFYKTAYKDLLKVYKNFKSIPFDELPPVKKETINKFLPFDLLSEKLKNKVFKYAETTGSTGSPTPSFFTKKEFYGSVVLSKITPYSTLIGEVLKQNRRAVCGLACGFTIANASFHQILDHFGFLTINVDARTTISPPHRVARLLSRFKPSVIAASETDFLSWMKVLKERYPESYDDVVDNLQVLISTAELCSKARSSQIEKYFNIVHIDNYACVEGYFSVACPCGEKHVLPIYHTEVLSEDLKTTNEYGTGRFAFTNLLRKSTPFVRYMLDDLVTIYPTNCKYGFTKSILPHDRYELTVKINDKRYGTRHFEEILFKNYLFGEYQIILNNDSLDIIAEDYANEILLENEIIKNFESEFKMPVNLKIVESGTIRNYNEIRQSKPLFRLIDKRVMSTQKIPQYV